MLTCDVVHATVDDDPHAVALVLVLRDVGYCVLVRHVVRLEYDALKWTGLNSDTNSR